jgi:hypothetical protein
MGRKPKKKTGAACCSTQQLPPHNYSNPDKRRPTKSIEQRPDVLMSHRTTIQHAHACGCSSPPRRRHTDSM